MKRSGLTIAMVLALSVPAYAGYRTDCSSVGSWFGHVRVAFGKLIGGTVSASIPDLTKMALHGQFNTEEGAGVAVTLAAQTLAMHVNPLALFDMGAAMVCFPPDDDGVNP